MSDAVADIPDGPLPKMPWERSRKTPAPTRVPLTQSRIVDAAFTVLDRQGLDGLSMRQVAAELGVAVSALYAHVSAKDELLELMYSRMFVGVEVPDPDPERWQEQIKEFARNGRARLLEHRDMARISMAHVPFTAELLPQVERLLAVFRTAGLPDRIAAVAGDVLSTYIEGFALEEGVWAERMRNGADRGDAASWQKVWSELEGYLASLPPGRFPHLVALSDLMTGESQDDRFEVGLEIILHGLASYLGEGRAPEKRP